MKPQVHLFGGHHDYNELVSGVTLNATQRHHIIVQ